MGQAFYMATIFVPPAPLSAAPALIYSRPSWRQRLERILEQGMALLAATALLATTVWPEPTLAAATLLPDSSTIAVFSYDTALTEEAIDSLTLTPRQPASLVLPDHVPVIPTTVQTGQAFRVVATAYSSTFDQTDGDPFITASGARVGPATIAANFLPLGAHIMYGGRIYIVQDRMNSRYNHRAIIDIWHPTTAAARQFGVRLIEIEIVSLPGESS